MAGLCTKKLNILIIKNFQTEIFFNLIPLYYYPKRPLCFNCQTLLYQILTKYYLSYFDCQKPLLVKCVIVE